MDVVGVFYFEVELESFFFVVGAVEEHVFGVAVLGTKSTGASWCCHIFQPVHVLF